MRASSQAVALLRGSKADRVTRRAAAPALLQHRAVRPTPATYRRPIRGTWPRVILLFYTAIDCYPLGIRTVILLPLLPCSAKRMTVSPRASGAAVVAREVGGRPELGDAAVVHHDDAVGVEDRVDAVRDREHRRAALPHLSHHEIFSTTIQPSYSSTKG